MEELENAGVTGFVGKVNMDRNGGENLEETTEESIRETRRWLEAAAASALSVRSSRRALPQPAQTS